MATSTVTRLAPVTARDGVDTRNKDNSVMPAGGSGETACLEVRSQDRDAQTAAITYLIPPGAEVEGSAMNAYWTNYLRTAENYVKGDPLEHFKFTSFKYQQGFNEADIKRECYKLGAGEEMLTIYRQFYNSYVTEYREDPNPRNLKYALDMLAEYNKELADQTKAAKLIQQAYRAFKAPKVQASETGTLIAEDDREDEDYGKCVKCDERRMGDWVDLCAYCYWDEDAEIKRKRRARRQNAIPSGGYTVQVNTVLIPEPEVDIMAVVNKAIDPTGVPGWDAFWAQHCVAGLRIRKPKPKYPCKCGAESTTRVKGRNMCEPCADLAMNVGSCYDCGAIRPRNHSDMCYDCYDAYLDHLDREEERRRYDGYPW